MKDIIRMNQLAGIITEGQAKKMLKVLNEGVVSAPLSNLEWKLDPKVKEYINVSSTEEALSFIESLTDEELNNLYTWRLGFNIPQSKDEKIKNLLDEFTRNQDTLFGQK
jgi:hypothetical protein